MTQALLQGQTLYGMTVRASPLAVKQVAYWEVHKHPIPKRRRGWAAVKLYREEPVAYVMAGVAFVHPSIYEKLKRELPPLFNR